MDKPTDKSLATARELRETWNRLDPHDYDSDAALRDDWDRRVALAIDAARAELLSDVLRVCRAHRNWCEQKRQHAAVAVVDVLMTKLAQEAGKR